MEKFGRCFDFDWSCRFSFVLLPTAAAKKIFQQNLTSLELKLENLILNSPFVLSAESEKHIEQLEILAKQLVQEAF